MTFDNTHAGQQVRLKDDGERVEIEFFDNRDHPVLGGPTAVVHKLDGSGEQFSTLQSNLDMEPADA